MSDDGIPTPRDVALIRLVDACGRFEQLVPPRELKRARQRISQLRTETLAGHAVAAAVERKVARLSPPEAALTLDPPGYDLTIDPIPIAHPTRAFKFRMRPRNPNRS